MRAIAIREVELGFWGVALAVIGVTLGVNQVIKMAQVPRLKYAEIPGLLGSKPFQAGITSIIQESRLELEVLHAQEVKLAEEQRAVEERIIEQERLKQMAKKAAPFIVVGGVAIALFLLAKRRKK